MDYIIKTKLSGIGKAVQRNEKSSKFDKAEKASNGRTILPLFSGLQNPQKIIQQLMEKFELDMKLFGYGYEIKDNYVMASYDDC